MGRSPGRPRMDDPKKRMVGVKMNKQELSRLKEYAEKHNMTITDVIKEALELEYNKESEK